MTHRITRFLLRQKLLLGVLWLMLRGSSADGQELQINNLIKCYFRYVPPKKGNFWYQVIHKKDFSAAVSVQNNSLSPLKETVFQFGHNFGSITTGVETHVSSSGHLMSGGYIRYFPKKKSEPFTTFTEFSYVLGNKNSMNESFGISVGVIWHTLHSWPTHSTLAYGIELFEKLHTEMSMPSGYFLSTGIRIHLYNLNGFND